MLDEPLNALDDELKERILSYIKRVIAEYRLPTLLVSHDKADVAYLTDESIAIARGGIAKPEVQQ